MTDEHRKMLECAAKASGVNLEWDGPPEGWQPMFYRGKTYHAFDPLTDDGDAFRLMVELRLNVFQAASCSWAVDEEAETETRVEGCNAEKVRRAIILAAARLGGYDK